MHLQTVRYQYCSNTVKVSVCFFSQAWTSRQAWRRQALGVAQRRHRRTRAVSGEGASSPSEGKLYCTQSSDWTPGDAGTGAEAAAELAEALADALKQNRDQVLSCRACCKSSPPSLTSCFQAPLTGHICAPVARLCGLLLYADEDEGLKRALPAWTMHCVAELPC